MQGISPTVLFAQIIFFLHLVNELYKFALHQTSKNQSSPKYISKVFFLIDFSFPLCH